MVNKPKQAGTAWETEFVRRAQDAGLVADRLAEGGSFDPGDVWINSTPVRYAPALDIGVLAWKRLTGNGSRRTPDGLRDVVVVQTDDLFDLIYWANKAGYPRSVVVECKARQNLNVTRTLAKTIDKLNKWKAKR